MSTQYRTSPSAFVRYDKREVLGAENNVCRRSPPPSLRGGRIIMLAVDGLAALRALLKKRGKRRRDLRGLAERDEDQLRDIRLPPGEGPPGHPIGYRALAGLDEVRRHLP